MPDHDALVRVPPRASDSFVAIYPPVSSWDEDGAESFRRALESPCEQPGQTPFGLYVHIPFCVKRCDSCYQLSYDDGREEIAAYLDCVVSELQHYAAQRRIAGRPLSSVYIGGGTPSILSRQRIGRFLSCLHSIMPWDAVREVTFECAPASVRQDKLEVLRRAGVSRVSLGVDQLDDEILTANGRVHLVSDVERAVADARRVGFDVLNLDLIVGMAGETDRSFFSSLDRVLELAPESITIYQTELPPNTPLDRAETLRRICRAYARVGEAGYSWRSAYTAVRLPDRHTFVYQDEQYAGADLIGIGASSLGYVDGVHEQNVTSLDRYIAAVSTGALPLLRGRVLSRAERLVREFVLQLRLGRVDLGRLDRRFGSGMTTRFGEALGRFEEQRLLSVEDRWVTLSPDGLARVDQMIPAFYLPEHREIRRS